MNCDCEHCRNGHPERCIRDWPVVEALDYSNEPCVCATRWTCMADKHDHGTPW